MPDITERQALIIELLRAGYSTGMIQATLKAARTTISKCKKLLLDYPDMDTQDRPEIRSQILKALTQQALSGKSGAAAAANAALKLMESEDVRSKPDD